MKNLKIVLLAAFLSFGAAACTTVEPAPKTQEETVVTRSVVMACEDKNKEKVCPDCSTWKERAMRAEEKASRLQQQLQDCLRK